MDQIEFADGFDTPDTLAFGLGAGQLARLERALGDARLAGKVRVVAIHHPPAGRRARNRIRGLRDHEAFAAVIARSGADVVVHGHEHRDMTEVLPGPAGGVQVLGVPSGTYEHDRPERTARYRLFEVKNGKLQADHLRVWDRTARCFRDDTSPPRATRVHALESRTNSTT